MKKLFAAFLAICLLVSLAVPVLADTEPSESNTPEAHDETTGTTAAPETTEATQATEPAPATSGMCGNGISWALNGNTLTISGSGKMYDFGGDTPWAIWKDRITAVTFTGGVTYVGANAFNDYDKITSVSFGSDLYELGASAFRDCDGLTTISLPAAFKIFGADCLRSCDNLKRINCAGRFPRFNDNCLWDTYATIYFPAENPWSAKDIKDLEKAFNGRIEFLASDGSDPVPPTEAPKPTEKPQEKPVQQATEASTETGTAPTWSSLEQTEEATITRPTLPKPTEAVIEEDNGGGFSGWVAIVVVIGLLAAFVAVTLALQQANQRKQKSRRRQRPDFQ